MSVSKVMSVAKSLTAPEVSTSTIFVMPGRNG